MSVKPFLKWVGGKSQILAHIRGKYPIGLGSYISKYAEPFIGGGAVLFDILSRYDMKEVYISDINQELIQTYITVRDHIDELICSLTQLERQYLCANAQERKEIYYAARDRFNKIKSAGNKTIEIASLFVFLNKTCFNGLYRVNARGVFNVPQGNYKSPTICNENLLQKASKKLQGVTIVCADYKDSRHFIDNRTFVYFDPPYRPLSATASFSSYAEKGFGDKEQIDLAHFIDELSEKGAYVAASNSDPKNADGTDNFFDSLYSKHVITRIGAKRMINSSASDRGKVNELFIATYTDT